MDNSGKGYIFIDSVEVAETRQCCHCGMHFPYQAGSGRRRGFCMLCMAMTCGCPECMTHFPFEKKLDLLEKREKEKGKI